MSVAKWLSLRIEPDFWPKQLCILKFLNWSVSPYAANGWSLGLKAPFLLLLLRKILLYLCLNHAYNYVYVDGYYVKSNQDLRTNHWTWTLLIVKYKSKTRKDKNKNRLRTEKKREEKRKKKKKERKKEIKKRKEEGKDEDRKEKRKRIRKQWCIEKSVLSLCHIGKRKLIPGIDCWGLRRLRRKERGGRDGGKRRRKKMRRRKKEGKRRQRKRSGGRKALKGKPRNNPT